MNMDVGFIQWYSYGDRKHVERSIQQMKELGVKHLRTGMQWADWHRSDAPEWFDWYVPRIGEELDLVPCFSYTPPSRGEFPRTSAPPRDLTEYAGYTGQMIERYGEHFDWVELWNEPNNRAEWDFMYDPGWEKFARMVTLGAQTAHEKGKKVLLGGLSPIDPTFLRRLGELGVLQHVDAIGVHGFPGTWERNWHGWNLELERIQKVHDEFGVDPEIWGTEIGFSTRKHRETEQVEVFLEALDQPFSRLYWYTLEDLHPSLAANSGFHQDEREYHHGVVKVNGQPKLLHRLWRRLGLEGIHEASWVTKAPRLEEDERPVVITGGAGFVGTNLADRLLSEGRSVLILDNLSREGAWDNVQWLRRRHGEQAKVMVASLLQKLMVEKALEQASLVVHLASQVAVTTSLEHPDVDFETNVQGTFNILEALRHHPDPPPIVYSSTNKVYGDLSDHTMRKKSDRWVPEDPVTASRGINEEAPLKLHTPYGCSKGAAEQYVLDYARMYGIPGIVFRMSCTYGPHQHGTEEQGWVAHFLLQSARRDPITIYGDGRQVRDVLYVDDLVDAFLLAERHADKCSGQAFNIGGGPENTLSLLELLRQIAKLDGNAPTTLYRETRPGDQVYYVSDPTKFYRTTGWRPKTSVQEGLKRLHEWIHTEKADQPTTMPLTVRRRS